MVEKSIKKNAIYNVINQGSAIFFQLITIKYVTSVLHTENYGRVNFCNSIISYFFMLAQLGISSYMVREGAAIRDDKKKFNDLANEIFTISVLSTLVSILLYIVTIFAWGRLEKDKLILYILGIQLVLNFFNVEWINNIYEDFKYIAIRNLIIQIISFFCIFLFVKNKDDFLIYALIIALSSSLSFIVNFTHGRKVVELRFTSKINLKRHIVPIMILFFNNLSVLVYVNSDITILGILESDSTVGIYSVSVKIYTVVKRIFQAIVVVSIPRLSNYLSTGQSDNYRNLLEKIQCVLVSIVFPMFVGLFMVAPNAILILSEPEYLSGVTALRILCVALIFSSLANYHISCILIPNKLDKMVLFATIISAFVNVLMNFILIPHLSLNGAAITTVMAEAIVMIIVFISSGEYRRQKNVVNVMFKSIVGCIGIVLVCSAIQKFDFSFVIDTLLKIAISIVVYVIIECMVKNQLFVDNISKLFGRLNMKI